MNAEEADDRSALNEAFPDAEIFPSSAKTKEGIDLVRHRLFPLKK